MTVQNAIVLFPVFESSEEIEDLRRAYDPLASVLPAHVTVVFPFVDTAASRVLHEHSLAAIGIFPSFDIAVATPTPEDGGYLFLRVTEGRKQVVELHDRLYTGPRRRISPPCTRTSPT